MRWILTHEKFLDEAQVEQFRRTLEEAMFRGKKKGLYLPVRDYTILELALGTGLRVSEISNLKVADLNLKKGQNMLIVRSGKGGKMRQVKFSSKLSSILQDYLDYRFRDTEHVFYSERQDQMTISAIQRVFKKYAKKAGLPEHYSIHSLRHTYGTLLYKRSGHNLRMVQKQLGHNSPVTTAVYADIFDEDLEDALENL